MQTRFLTIAMTLAGIAGCGSNDADGTAPVAASIGGYDPIANNRPPQTAQPLKFSIASSPLKLQPQTVVSKSSDGVIRFEWDSPQYFRESRGYCLAFLHPELTTNAEGKSSRLLRARISALDDQGAAPSLFAIDIPRSAVPRIRVGDKFILFGPGVATAEQLKDIPDSVAVDTDSLHEASVLAQRKTDEFNKLATMIKKQTKQPEISTNNLEQIAIAFHNFHDTYRGFPAAVTLGPDGKPWHSWRVLILPFLEQHPLYAQYSFEEPWDGPNNSKLHDKMPDVYRMPGDKSLFTHYVVATSRDAPPLVDVATIFSAIGVPSEEGAKFSTGGGLRNVIDGTSNTILVGTVDIDKRIPWMKPQDLELGRDFEKLGDEGGFATPYMSDDGDFGLFAIADGSVTSIHKSVPDDDFRNLLIMNDGNPVGEYSNGSNSFTLVPPVLHFDVEIDPKQEIARFTLSPTKAPKTDPVPSSSAEAVPELIEEAGFAPEATPDF